MRFGLMSDIHLEYRKLKIKPKDLDGDVIDMMLLAGDIGPGALGVDWAYRMLVQRGIPVLYIAGNHEFYTNKYTYYETKEKLASWSKNGLTVLQDSAFEISEEKIVVLGSTLWIDFLYNGSQSVDLERYPKIMNDYRWHRQKSEWILNENQNSVAYLQSEIQRYQGLGWKIVVMTHHAPTWLSQPRNKVSSPDGAFYMNTFDQYPNFMWPDVWVHGHIHEAKRYQIHNCTVMSNPCASWHRRDVDLNYTFTV